MSHITTIDVELMDEAVLVQAAENLGLERRDVQHYREYYSANSSRNKCDFALGVKGHPEAYEIGVTRKDGRLVLAFDTYGGGGGLLHRTQNVVDGKLNGPMSKLVQEYSKLIAIRELRRKGYMVRESKNSNGEVVLMAV